MMKFFRKYNKQLLAVFMVGLMIVFVGGSALQGLLTPEANPVVAQSRFGPITLMDQNVANEKGKLLESLGIDWRHPAGWTAKPVETMDWILLRREAEALDAAASDAAIRSSLADPDLDGRVNELSRQMRVRPEALQTALADLRSIQQAATAVAGASVPSEAELMHATRNALETVSLRAVVLPAAIFIDESLEFSEQEIKAHFEKHREKEPDKGLTFGYYQQPSLKVQYVKIDREAIARDIGIANLERKAKAHYDEKRATDPAFARPNRNEPDPAAAGKIEGPPGPPLEPYLRWEEAKDAAIRSVREQSAEQAADRLANWIIQYTAESFLEVERSPDGYKPAPAVVTRPEYYADLIGKVPATIAFPKAVSVGETGFFTSKDADEVPELGAARFQPEKGVSRAFADLVFRTQAVVPKVPTEEGTNHADFTSTFQTFPYPLRDADTSSLYVFRVVETKPAHAPQLVDEVRDQVIADMRLARAFEVAKARADSLRQCLSYQTLKEAYDSDLELVDKKQHPAGGGSGYFEPPPFARVPRYMAARGRPATGVPAGAGLGTLPNNTVDDCFALEGADEKTKILELQDRPAVILVEWIETKPAPEDEFNTLRKQLVQQLGDARWRSAVADWLDPQQVRARAGFTFGTQ